MSTGIEWTHIPGFKGETWNPVTGCSKVSAGCKHCYAIDHAHRLAGNPNPKIAAAYQGLTTVHTGAKDGKLLIYRPSWTGKVRCLPERLELPLRWRKPRAVFVNSMSDLFHEDVRIDFIAEVFNVMASGLLTCRKVDCDHDDGEDCFVENPHIFMVLTKRHKRMLEILRPGGELDQEVAENWPGDSPISSAMEDGEKFKTWPLPNMWLGVSVEDQATADERIPLLLETPAAVRFVSYEPALGPVDFREWLHVIPHFKAKLNAYSGRMSEPESGWLQSYHIHTREPIPSELDWVICGGESGPNARPMHPDWARSVRDQCSAAQVPFFFKQWGEWRPYHGIREEPGPCIWPDGKLSPERDPTSFEVGDGCCPIERVGKKAAGRLLDGREHNEFPATAGRPEPAAVTR